MRTLVAVCLCVVVGCVPAPPPPPSPVVGLWQHGATVVEFRQDGAWAMVAGEDGLCGQWRDVGDGRLRITTQGKQFYARYTLSDDGAMTYALPNGKTYTLRRWQQGR